jgi:Arc/MetJ-type ribon-helix-helix transcriptional regulator
MYRKCNSKSGRDITPRKADATATPYKTVNVNVPEGLLARVMGELKTGEYKDRSDVIVTAIRFYLDEKELRAGRRPNTSFTYVGPENREVVARRSVVPSVAGQSEGVARPEDSGSSSG